MNKNELIHLHSLLRHLQRELAAEGLVDPSAFAEYEGLDISPQHVYKAKQVHQDAVLLLARVLADELCLKGKYGADDEASEPIATES